MGALLNQAVSTDWAPLPWFWLFLYGTLGVCAPFWLIRTWEHQHARKIQAGPRQLFKFGELGLVSLILAISVIWDLQKSQFTSHTVALGSILLAFGGVMAGVVWTESYCRRCTGKPFSTDRTWRDSRNLALMVFSMASVVQILITRMAKVTAP